MKNSLSAALAITIVVSSCTHAPTKKQEVAQAVSSDPVPYRPNPRGPAAAELSWFAATEQQVKNAVCRIQYPVTTAEIQRYYDSLPQERGYEAGTTEVGGIALVNERPQLVLALAKLLSPANKDEKVDKVPKDFQTSFKVNPTCTKALCAAQKIFGGEVGPQMIFLMDKFDVNTSRFAYGSSDNFTKSEIADVIRTFELSHSDQIPLSFNQQLTKFKRGHTRPEYGADGVDVMANAAIELFDGWSSQSSLLRQYTLFHEIAHNHSDNQFNDYDRSNAWMAISNWRETKEDEFEIARTKTMRGHPFVSEYGETNPFEDFAESVSAYRFNPGILKKKSPEKYNLIKLFVFDGLEYTSPEACQRTPMHKALQSRVDAGNFAFNSTDKEIIKKSCRIPFYQAILGNTPVSFFDSCVNYEATVIWQRSNVSTYPDLVPQALFDNKLRISRLKFPAMRNELASELTPEAARWIYDSVNVYAHQMHSQMSNAEYCSVWTKLGDKVYPDFSRDTHWQKNAIFVNGEYSPHSGAARGICLDLVNGYTPVARKKSSLSDWFAYRPGVKEQSQPSERGVNQEALLKYISERMKNP